MSSRSAPAPTHEQFVEVCRRAFAFLADHGFREVVPPRHRQGNRFLVWFRARERSVTISGEGWGQFAECHLEHDSGVRTAPIYLVPVEHRATPHKRRKNEPGIGQLAEIRREAERVQAHCRDFVEGDLERFFRIAKPLPSYMLPPEQGDVSNS
jgi:hypothetical protein